jgi:hypothetical protein
MRHLEGIGVVLHMGGKRLPGTIESGDSRQLVLVLDAAPDPALPGREAVVAEYATPLGVHRVHGRITTVGGRVGVLRLSRSGGEVIQRREWARVDVAVPVRLTAALGVVRTHTQNLSAGGMLVRDPLRLDDGESVTFALELTPGGAWIDGAATVVGARRDEGIAALRIDRVAASDRERIVRWILERQRHAIRMVRGGA